jgi:hypothetical protein
MADGDLISTYNQYEFNRLLMGARTSIKLQKITGMLGTPPVRTYDSELQGGWGSFPGLDLYGPRTITFDIFSDAPQQLGVERDLLAVTKAFTIDRIPHKKFVMLRDNGMGKRFMWAKPGNTDFDAGYDTSMGILLGTIELVGNDPRYYSLEQVTTNITIPNGATNAGGVIHSEGGTDSSPVLIIHGPSTNPRISCAEDSNKQVKLDVIITGGHWIKVDIRNHTVVDDLGADVFLGTVRDDSEWWRIQPDVDNNIAYNRTNTIGSSKLEVITRDAWAA